MAYAKSYRRGTRRPGRGRSTAARGKTAPSVVVKKRVKLAKKSTVMRVQRGLRQLRMSQFGSVQRNVCILNEVLTPVALRPILFAVDDFTRETVGPPTTAGGAAYQRLDPTPVPPADPVGAVAHWHTTPGAASDPFHQGYQDDIPNGGKYLAQYCRLTFELQGRPTLSNTRIRIQVFKQKMNAIYSAAAGQPGNMLLPDALIYLKHQASFASGHYLPGKFFHKMYDKTVIISSAPANITGVARHPTTMNKKYCSYTWRPRNGKCITQKYTNPNVQNSTESEVAQGNFGPLQRNPGDIVWCLVSTDDDSSALNPGALSVLVKRLAVWRDPIGSYH